MLSILWQANVLSILQQASLLSTSGIQNSIYFNMSAIQPAWWGKNLKGKKKR